jgi:hypothetical protein
MGHELWGDIGTPIFTIIVLKKKEMKKEDIDTVLQQKK